MLRMNELMGFWSWLWTCPSSGDLLLQFEGFRPKPPNKLPSPSGFLLLVIRVRFRFSPHEISYSRVSGHVSSRVMIIELLLKEMPSRPAESRAMAWEKDYEFGAESAEGEEDECDEY
ncbi:hypothetical protein HHK36_021270 [Tetracentron sinense]|uniref:Uncharacterized protein n=1 Tax=Tetracentron sinense TaxID=13715 RepID=A0A834YPE9_TETSI|nr:hypothetical protein HHK36_021270 [Tetracentron sinense]